MPRDFVLYILPFGLVRLRTFLLAHGLVRCNIHAGVHARAHREDVSFRDVKIKIPDWNWDQGMWVTSHTGSVGWGFWDLRKSRSWVPASEQESWDSELGEAIRICALCKSSQLRKIVSLSPYVKKPLTQR